MPLALNAEQIARLLGLNAVATTVPVAIPAAAQVEEYAATPEPDAWAPEPDLAIEPVAEETSDSDADATVSPDEIATMMTAASESKPEESVNETVSQDEIAAMLALAQSESQTDEAEVGDDAVDARLKELLGESIDSDVEADEPPRLQVVQGMELTSEGVSSSETDALLQNPEAPKESLKTKLGKKLKRGA
jgi:hypothetical protein